MIPHKLDFPSSEATTSKEAPPWSLNFFLEPPEPRVPNTTWLLCFSALSQNKTVYELLEVHANCHVLCCYQLLLATNANDNNRCIPSCFLHLQLVQVNLNVTSFSAHSWRLPCCHLVSLLFGAYGSLIKWPLKFLGWPSGAPLARLSTWPVSFHFGGFQVTKKQRPSSPALLLVAQNRMIKGGVSHQRNRQQCYCTFKGGRCHIARWQQRDVDLRTLSPSRVRSEEAQVDVCCYAALSDLTSAVEEASWRTDLHGCVSVSAPYIFFCVFCVKLLFIFRRRFEFLLDIFWMNY